MKFNKMYFQKDAIARHEDFDVWYGDGELALHFESEWKSESDQVYIHGRLGGQIAKIKPDNRALGYYLKYERWECEFHAMHIFRHYFVEGRAWDIYGSYNEKLPLDFVNVNTGKKEVHVRQCEFKDKGTCIEVTARDVSVLRLAVQVMVAMAIKEEYKGLSDGELPQEKQSLVKKMSEFFSPKGVPYSALFDEEGNELVPWVPGDMSKGPKR